MAPYFENDSGVLYCGDCFEILPELDIMSDMVLTDMPYNTTDCEWDIAIPLDKLWIELKRIAKDNAAFVMTGSQPFTTDLINSNRKDFKYEWIWEKSRPTNQMLARKQVLKSHENILVFGKKDMKYNPQMWKGYKNHGTKEGVTKQRYLNRISTFPINVSDIKYPRSVIKILSLNPFDYLHPTQKPVELFDYLIRTYTDESETCLDPFAGSSTTAIAAIRTGRRYVCIEKEEKYCGISVKRILKETEQFKLEGMI